MNGSYVDKIAADQALIHGIQAYLSQLAQVTVGSQVMTPAAIVQALQDRITVSQAAVTADAARTAAVKACRDKRSQTTLLVSSLRRLVTGMYSNSPDTLAAFGLKAPKGPKTSVAVKAEAAAKATATRKAGGKKAVQAQAQAAATHPAQPQAAPVPAATATTPSHTA